MNRSKGVSQVLALIIAAAVLMMAALTLIFLTQSSLGETNDQKNVASCQQSIRGLCQFQSGSKALPATCNGLSSSQLGGIKGVSGDTVDCNQY